MTSGFLYKAKPLQIRISESLLNKLSTRVAYIAYTNHQFQIIMCNRIRWIRIRIQKSGSASIQPPGYGTELLYESVCPEQGFHRNGESVSRNFGQFRSISRNFAKFRSNFGQFREGAFREISDYFGKIQKIYIPKFSNFAKFKVKIVFFSNFAKFRSVSKIIVSRNFGQFRFAKFRKNL